MFVTKLDGLRDESTLVLGLWLDDGGVVGFIDCKYVGNVDIVTVGGKVGDGTVGSDGSSNVDH